MILQINRFDTVLKASEEDLTRIQAEFNEKHCVIFPKLLAPDLLQSVLQGIDQAEFNLTENVNMIAKDIHIGQEDPTNYLMNFLMNNETLSNTVQRVTGCSQFGMYLGRIYRMMPTHDHYDSWHDDLVFNRVAAMSINLTPEPYAGGTVQFRETKSGRIVNEVHNVGLGDAMIFRIAPYLEHRVTPVTGTVPRTAFAGWFESKPTYRTWLESGYTTVDGQTES